MENVYRPLVNTALIDVYRSHHFFSILPGILLFFAYRFKIGFHTLMVFKLIEQIKQKSFLESVEVVVIAAVTFGSKLVSS